MPRRWRRRSAGRSRCCAIARRIADRVEPVAGAAHGDDLEAELAKATELLAQPSDVDVDRLAVAEVGVTPDLLEKDLAGEDPTRPAYQVGEQVPFLRRQLQLGVVNHGPPSGPVDSQPADPVFFDLRANVTLLAAAEHGRHPREELAPGAPFGD